MADHTGSASANAGGDDTAHEFGCGAGKTYGGGVRLAGGRTLLVRVVTGHTGYRFHRVRADGYTFKVE
jgi:hypothetical protein